MNRPSWGNFLSDYWKVPLVALMAGLLAFGASFMFGAEYVSRTRLLIHGREATFLTDNGTNLSNQPGVVDSTLATALSDTEGALLNSNTVAEAVVQDLKLDSVPPKKRGPLGKIKHALSDFYKEAKAVLTHGFYATPDKHDANVDLIYASIGASQVKGSYVLELAAAADDPKLAAAIANAAADELVKLGSERFKAEATSYRDFLATQVTNASNASAAAARAVSDYEVAHHITDAGTQVQLSTESLSQLNTELQTTQTDLAAAQGELTSLRASLESTSPNATNSQQIQTGRSTTNIDTTTQSQSFAQLSAAAEQQLATVAGLQSREQALTQAISSATGSGAPLTQQSQELSQLAVRQQVATSTYTSLAAQYNQAVTNAADDPLDLSRVDSATPPLYPIKPVRYFYLLVGLAFGAALSALWCYFAANRNREGDDEDLSSGNGTGVIDLLERPAEPNGAQPVRVAALQTPGGTTEGRPDDGTFP